VSDAACKPQRCQGTDHAAAAPQGPGEGLRVKGLLAHSTCERPWLTNRAAPRSRAPTSDVIASLILNRAVAVPPKYTFGTLQGTFLDKSEADEARDRPTGWNRTGERCGKRPGTSATSLGIKLGSSPLLTCGMRQTWHTHLGCQPATTGRVIGRGTRDDFDN
jgi:hypothetical protein